MKGASLFCQACEELPALPSAKKLLLSWERNLSPDRKIHMPHPRIPDFRKDQLKAFQPRENLRHKRPLLVLVPDSQSPPTSGMRLRQAFSAASAMPIACLQVSGLSPVSALPNPGWKTILLQRLSFSPERADAWRFLMAQCRGLPSAKDRLRLACFCHEDCLREIIPRWGKSESMGTARRHDSRKLCPFGKRLMDGRRISLEESRKASAPRKNKQAKTVRGR